MTATIKVIDGVKEYSYPDLYPSDIDLVKSSIYLTLVERHHVFIEDEITLQICKAKQKRDNAIKMLNVKNLDEEDWQMEHGLIDHEHYYQVNVAIPMLLRGSYVVMLYAAFESSVHEISDYLIKTYKIDSVNKNARGDLDWKKVIELLKSSIQFDLETSVHYQSMIDLKEVRNAYAHSSGRIELVKNSEKLNEIPEVEKKDAWYIVTEEFTERTTNAVLKVLEEMFESSRTKELENRS